MVGGFMDWEQNAKDLARVRDTLYARIDDLSEMLAKAQSERDALQAKIDAAENVMRTAHNLLLQIGSSIEGEGEVGLGVAAEQSVRVADEIRKVLEGKG